LFNQKEWGYLMKKTEKILFLGFSVLMFILIGCSNKDNLQENKKAVL